MLKITAVALATFMLSAALQTAQANERKFAYTYETSVLPQGARELELWNTYQTGKPYFYRQLNQRVEYEFGLGGNLMTSLYMNYEWKTADSNGDLLNGDAVNSSSVSISNEWKYKLSDRTADPIGFGLYGEATLGLDESELEGKLLFDKQLGKTLLAFNAVFEREWESGLQNGATVTEGESKLEFNLGASFAFMQHFSAGVEVFNQNLLGAEEGETGHSALFAGPVVSYTAENWWATLTFMPQLASLENTAKGKLDLDEYQKYEARLLFSFHL
ncbi:MAG: hypothetical protein KGJ59_01190 [Bacteroidota bacterium]|nr:hypothetical protein [Bacteroidota bacterium]